MQVCLDHYNVRLNSATGYSTPKDMLAGAAGDPHGARREVGGGWKNAEGSPTASCMMCRCQVLLMIAEFRPFRPVEGSGSLNFPFAGHPPGGDGKPWAIREDLSIGRPHLIVGRFPST